MNSRVIARFASTAQGAWIVSHDSGSSRIAWLFACVHAACFGVAVANMSPPWPGLGNFLDAGGYSSAVLFAGRPFHFFYESPLLKCLVVLNLPATVAVVLPVGLLFVTPLCHVFGFKSAFALSYVDAGLTLLAATLQWLVIGRKVELWLARRLPFLWTKLSQSALVLIGCRSAIN